MEACQGLPPQGSLEPSPAPERQGNHRDHCPPRRLERLQLRSPGRTAARLSSGFRRGGVCSFAPGSRSESWALDCGLSCRAAVFPATAGPLSCQRLGPAEPASLPEGCPASQPRGLGRRRGGGRGDADRSFGSCERRVCSGLASAPCCRAGRAGSRRAGAEGPPSRDSGVRRPLLRGTRPSERPCRLPVLWARRGSACRGLSRGRAGGLLTPRDRAAASGGETDGAASPRRPAAGQGTVGPGPARSQPRGARARLLSSGRRRRRRRSDGPASRSRGRPGPRKSARAASDGPAPRCPAPRPRGSQTAPPRAPL